MTAWRPILEGDDAVRARAAVIAVVDALRPEPGLVDPEEFTLGRGEPGSTLLFAYAARVFGDENLADLAIGRLSRVVDGAGAGVENLFLWTGLAGIAWSVEHVTRLLGAPSEAAAPPDDEDDPNEVVDQAILELFDLPTGTVRFELLKGLAGLGVYALERWPRPRAVRMLELTVVALDHMAERSPAGATWFTPPVLMTGTDALDYPAGYHSIGMAHGCLGPMVVLAAACARGVRSDLARPLLDRALEWTWSQRLRDESRGSFPLLGEEPTAARPGWCYGDPGVASAFWIAAHATDQPVWAERARALMLAVASRRPESCGLDDAMMCHGAAGLAHMLNRFFQRTGDKKFGDAARTWYRRALEDWAPPKGIGGFTSVGFDQGVRGEVPRAGLLDGSAGVALALLAAISSTEPGWDRVFALTLANAPR